MDQTNRETPLKFTQDFLSVSATPGGTYLRANYPYKIKQTHSMSRTLDGAWRRFEEQLRHEEESKRRQAENFTNAVIRDQQAIDAEVIRKMMIQEETRKELENQIVYKQLENEAEERERRKKERTSFGPEEDELLYQMMLARRNENKQATKQDLEELIKERQNKSDFVYSLERSLD